MVPGGAAEATAGGGEGGGTCERRAGRPAGEGAWGRRYVGALAPPRTRQGPRIPDGPMDDLNELARAYLDRRTAVAFLSTVNAKSHPETCVLAALRFAPDGSLAGGEEEGVCGTTFRNLRQNPTASILVLDPTAPGIARGALQLVRGWSLRGRSCNLTCNRRRRGGRHDERGTDCDGHRHAGIRRAG